jgi:hypothetical protein
MQKRKIKINRNAQDHTRKTKTKRKLKRNISNIKITALSAAHPIATLTIVGVLHRVYHVIEKCRAVEAHEVERQQGEFVGKVIELVQRLLQILRGELRQPSE